MVTINPSKKLTQLLKKLKKHNKYDTIRTSSSSSSSTKISFSSSSEFRASLYDDDDDEDSVCGAKDVPAGSLPVYVGQERRRFVIPTAYLGNAIFRVLLAKSEEEFGLRCDGGLRIACAPEVFEQFLKWLQGGDGADDADDAHCHRHCNRKKLE